MTGAQERETAGSSGQGFLAAIAEGDRLRDRGDYAAAIAVYEGSKSIDPSRPLAQFKIGTALQRWGRPAEAEAAYRGALEVDPDYPEANNNLGLLLRDRGDLVAAEGCFRRALDVRADYLEPAINLVAGLAKQDRMDEARSLAAASAGRAARTLPECLRLADCLRACGRRFDAAQVLFGALAARPEWRPEAACDLARLLVIFGETGHFDGIAWLGNLFNLAEALPEAQLGQGLLFFRLLPHVRTVPDGVRLLRLQQRYARWLAAKSADVAAPPSAPAPSGNRLRLGFLGALFSGNNAVKFLLPLLPHLRDEHLDLVWFSTAPLRSDDSIQGELRRHVETTIPVAELDDAGVARAIREVSCDVLIDLDGYSGISKIGALADQPAPVQINWLNWPGSLGMDAVRYLMSSEAMLPESGDLASESLLAMRTPYGCYVPLAESTPPARPPAIALGRVTFGTGAQPYKLTRPLVALWSRVLAAVPDSRFMVIRDECADQTFRESLAAEFARHGVTAGRLAFSDFRSGGRSHLDAYHSLDVVLDTVPYGGATSAADALWMGVPVVTIEGPGVHQRLSSGILRAVGAYELVCPDEAGYVACAVGLAKNLAALSDYRANLRGRMQASPLCDAPAVAAEFARCVRQAVERERRRPGGGGR